MIWDYISNIACVLKVISPLFKAINYSQQFLIVGMIPDFRPLEFSAVEYYQSLVGLGGVQIPIGLQEDTNISKI